MISREEFYNKYEYEITFEEAIRYKSIEFSTAKIRRYRDFFISSSCLSIKKNRISDINIIKMSYLEFLYSLMTSEDEQQSYAYCAMFFNIFNICCGLTPDDFSFHFDDNKKLFLTIKDEKYDKYDFDNMRNIILYQNMPDYDDTYIDPELEQAVNATEKLLSKNVVAPSLEKQITAIVSSSGYKYEEVYDISIRKFLLLIRTIDAKLHYQIYKTASLHPYVEFKEQIDHWLYERKRSILDGKIMGYNELKDKMKHVT